eukprot:m51a1_g8311 hypothetical protein (177) ;mRNA; f:83940-85834
MTKLLEVPIDWDAWLFNSRAAMESHVLYLVDEADTAYGNPIHPLWCAIKSLLSDPNSKSRWLVEFMRATTADVKKKHEETTGKIPEIIPNNTLFLIPDEFFETARLIWNTGDDSEDLEDTVIAFQAQAPKHAREIDFDREEEERPAKHERKEKTVKHLIKIEEDVDLILDHAAEFK